MFHFGFVSASLTVALWLGLAVAAGPVGEPPGGARQLSPGQLPRECTTDDGGGLNAYGPNFGYYWSENASQWIQAPFCYPRWGYLAASASQVVRYGDTITASAIHDDGRMPGAIAVQGGMSWSHPGVRVSGCETMDVTCTVKIGNADDPPPAEWAWHLFHATGPGRYFLLPASYAPRCQPDNPCLDTATNAWTYVGIAPAATDATLTATLEATPADVVVGDSFTVTMQVTNPSTNTSSLTDIRPAAPLTISGEGQVHLTGGPSPASVAALAPGASASFTWTFDATVDGNVGFNATAEAQTSSGGTISAEAACALGAASVGPQAAGREPPGCSTLGAAAVKIGSLAVELKPETQVPDTFVPGETIKFVVEARGCRPDGKITAKMDVPKGTTFVKGSAGVGKVKGNTVTWQVDGSRAKVAFKALVRDKKKLPKDFKQMKPVVMVRCTYPGGEKTAEATKTLNLTEVSVDVTDGSVENLMFGGAGFLPDPKNAQRLPSMYFSNLSHPTCIAADGVALLLLRATTDIKKHGKVKFTVEETLGAEPGSFWAPTDTALLDRSADGGARDTMEAGAPTVAVKSAISPYNKQYHVAFALFRAPRNFDVAGTGLRQSRPITLKVEVYDPKDTTVIASTELDFEVVRPLVILQHGTFDSPDGWLRSRLHFDTANEEKSFKEFSPFFPFQTARSDFSSYRKAAGDLTGSAPVAWASLLSKLAYWRNATQCVGAQVDAVAHSYGGVHMRWIAQSQADPNPVTTATTRNVRNATNWGHGILHKLVTIATTHRGSAVSNQLAYLNALGLKRGVIRSVAADEGSDIDLGGVEDQMVVSPILRQLRTTRVPGHAIAGSGLCDYNQMYAERLGKLYTADRIGGPFRSFGDPAPLPDAPNFTILRKMSNYGFDLGDTMEDDATQNPNYDLTVSSYSSKGGMPRRAQSTVDDLEAGIGLAPGSLVGRLTHGDEISKGGDSDRPVDAVAQRVAFLLRQATTSDVFAPFPAAALLGSTHLEDVFSNPLFYDPKWLYYGVLDTSAFGPTGRARDAAPTVFTIDPPTTTVTPGQVLQVTLTTPTAGIDHVLTTWPGSGPGDTNLAERTPGTSVFALTVPSRPPGPFGLAALVLAADGSVEEARLDLEIVDPEPYTALQIDPPTLVLRSSQPGAFTVRGRLPSGAWRTLNRSTHLQLASSDPSVATITADRTVAPAALGTATVTAMFPGGLAARLDVVVSGEPAQVTVSPRRKGKLRRRAQAPAEFVFLSNPTIDPARINRTTVRVGGQVPTKFVQTRDHNEDGIADLAAYVRPRALGLPKGPAAIGMSATLTDGPRIVGSAAAIVR